MIKPISEISPASATNPNCPFDCIGCEFFKGIHVYSNDDVWVECELENND